jgi:hypothetical protein
MMFKDWLELKKKEAVNTAENFIHQMDENKIVWPLTVRKKEDLRKVINESDVPESVKKTLLEDLGSLWMEYERVQQAGRENQQGMSGCIDKVISALILNPMVTVIAGLSVFLIVMILVAMIGENEFLRNLASVEFARGLITFLFAVGTIGIALIIIFSVFASERSLDESKERFYRGKEILTILIGILGTIVGFYFGSPTDTAQDISPFELSDIRFSELEPVMERPLSLFSLATGGRPPYKYALKIMEGDAILMEFKEKLSKDGLIYCSFSPGQRDTTYKITPILAVADAEGRSKEVAGDEVEIRKALGKEPG